MKYQTKYYIRGSICLAVAILFAILFPALVKHYNISFIEDYMLIMMKFIMLIAAGVYYLFSPKYYKDQVLDIICALLVYILYVYSNHIFFK